MDVLVVGASRGSGAAVVRALVSEGHRVTAFARSASTAGFGQEAAEVVRFDGDVTDEDAIAKAMVGQDAVVVTLGISDNPFKVRLTRRASSSLDVRSAGTRRVIEVMERAGVPRLVVQTTYGIGESRRRLPWQLKAFFAVAIAPQVRDSALQEELVRASGLEWTLIRPVVLTDDETSATPHVAADDDVVGFAVSRAQVARVVADVLTDPGSVGRTLSVSA